MTSSPPSQSKPISESALAVCDGMSEKSAVTLAFSSPERMLSFDALAPHISPTDSIIIDFPAPVSPVRTVKPLSKERRCSLIIATFFIYSSFSISCSSFEKICYASPITSFRSTANSSASLSFLVTMSIVSSPAMLPRILSAARASIAAAAAFAIPE